jgi:hypothetical protein
MYLGEKIFGRMLFLNKVSFNMLKAHPVTLEAVVPGTQPSGMDRNVDRNSGKISVTTTQRSVMVRINGTHHHLLC